MVLLLSMAMVRAGTLQPLEMFEPPKDALTIRTETRLAKVSSSLGMGGVTLAEVRYRSGGGGDLAKGLLVTIEGPKEVGACLVDAAAVSGLAAGVRAAVAWTPTVPPTDSSVASYRAGSCLSAYSAHWDSHVLGLGSSLPGRRDVQTILDQAGADALLSALTAAQASLAK